MDSNSITPASTSVFSKTIETVYPDFIKYELDDTFFYGIFAFTVFVCIISYVYRDMIMDKMQYYTLLLYLGKPNEIHATELPENSHLNSVYSNLDLLDNASENGSEYDTDTDI